MLSTFTSFVGLLFVLHGLKDSVAYAHQGREELLVTRKEAHASEQKEVLKGIVTDRTKIIGLGRGKMVEYKELRKYQNGVTSEISGEDRKASTDHSRGKSQENLISQQDITALLESNNLESVSLRTSRNEAINLLNSNPKHFQESKAEPLNQETTNENSAIFEGSVDDDTSKKDEARMLLEATKEIVNLMHKDYRGMGRRKPPINNHEPWH